MAVNEDGPEDELDARRAIKVFEMSVAPDENKLPFPFELKMTKGDGSTETHEFEAMADPGAGGLLAITGILFRDPGGVQRVDFPGLMKFFYRVMSPLDFNRMAELVDRHDLTIDINDLAAVYSWLAEEYTGEAPKAQSTGSANTGSRTGRSSTAKRSSRGRT